MNATTTTHMGKSKQASQNSDTYRLLRATELSSPLEMEDHGKDWCSELQKTLARIYAACIATTLLLTGIILVVLVTHERVDGWRSTQCAFADDFEPDTSPDALLDPSYLGNHTSAAATDPPLNVPICQYFPLRSVQASADTEPLCGVPAEFSYLKSLQAALSSAPACGYANELTDTVEYWRAARAQALHEGNTSTGSVSFHFPCLVPRGDAATADTCATRVTTAGTLANFLRLLGNNYVLMLRTPADAERAMRNFRRGEYGAGLALVACGVLLFTLLVIERVCVSSCTRQCCAKLQQHGERRSEELRQARCARRKAI